MPRGVFQTLAPCPAWLNAPRVVSHRALAIAVAAALTLFSAEAAPAVTVPAEDAEVLSGVRFDRGQAVGFKHTTRFQSCDSQRRCLDQAQPKACGAQPNRHQHLMLLDRGTVFFDSKLSVLPDGPSDSRLRFPAGGAPALDGARLPLIAIPEGSFGADLGVRMGDVAAVVYRGRKVYAVVADRGPACQIGEGSRALLEALQRRDCPPGTEARTCTPARLAPLSGEVRTFIFPGTGPYLMTGVTPESLEARLQQIGDQAWQRLTQP